MSRRVVCLTTYWTTSELADAVYDGPISSLLHFIYLPFSRSQNERRERLIILSRQTTSLSKKLIFHLHRSSLHPEHDQGEKNQAERKRILQEAEGKVKEIGDVLKTVGQELEQAGLDYWAFARSM